MGLWTGKKGSSVFYKLANSNNNINQGIREYQAVVSNPQTENQAVQRMKMTAAVNFYRQLSRILNNSYQGVEYGQKSMQAFMSRAMAVSSGFPFVAKGDKGFYPGNYEISSGSLPKVGVIVTTEGIQSTLLLAEDGQQSFGEWSQAVINANFGILNGDRITVIAVVQTSSGFAPWYSYVVLDTSSQDSMNSIRETTNIFIDSVGVGDDFWATFTPVAFTADPSFIVAAAIIVSRAPSTANSSWQRSTSEMQLSNIYMSRYMGTDRFNEVLPTYTGSASILGSNWYLNLGIYGNANDSEQQGAVTVQSQTNISVTISGTSRQVIIFTMSDGTKRAGSYDGHLVYQSGSNYYYLAVTSANAAALTAIQGADSAVTGWRNVPQAEQYQGSAEDNP